MPFPKTESELVRRTETARRQAPRIPETKTVNDLNKLGKLRGIYEFKPGHRYLFLFEGKKFSHEHAHALLKDLELAGVEFSVHIVATLYPKSIEVHSAEKDGEIGTQEK